jgi:protein TonB
MWPAALAIALFAHAAVIFAVIRQPDAALAGGGGQQVDAISVTMVHSEVLEAREPVRPEPASASAAASVESTDGAPQSVATAAAEQQEEKKVPPEEQQDKPKEEPVRDAEAVLETPRESQRQQKKQAAAAPPTGGAAARSDTASEARANAPAAASPGAVREYALYVAQALAKSKPKGSGGHGTVRVKFVISGDGGLSTVQVSSTSGSSKLDNIAIGAVRQTKFLVPPAGMTALQLTYEVPYHFR